MFPCIAKVWKDETSYEARKGDFSMKIDHHVLNFDKLAGQIVSRVKNWISSWLTWLVTHINKFYEIHERQKKNCCCCEWLWDKLIILCNIDKVKDCLLIHIKIKFFELLPCWRLWPACFAKFCKQNTMLLLKYRID